MIRLKKETIASFVKKIGLHIYVCPFFYLAD